MKTIPNYHPPQDYRRPTKTQEKVYVPVNDYPEINFSMIANPLTLTNFLIFPLNRCLEECCSVLLPRLLSIFFLLSMTNPLTLPFSS